MFAKIRSFWNTWKMGRAYVNGNYKLAIEEGKKSLGLRPEDPQTLVTLAECFFFIEDHEAAITYAKESMLCSEDDFDALKVLISAYFKAGDYTAAEQYVSQVLSKEKSDVPSVDEVAIGFGEKTFPGAPFLINQLEKIHREVASDRQSFISWCQNFILWQREKSRPQTH